MSVALFWCCVLSQFGLLCDNSDSPVGGEAEQYSGRVGAIVNVAKGKPLWQILHVTKICHRGFPFLFPVTEPVEVGLSKRACQLILLNNLPAVDAAVGGREVDADFEYPPRVVGERPCVAPLLDLCEGLVRGGVGLDLDDVDVVAGLDQDVDPAVGGRALRLHIPPSAR